MSKHNFNKIFLKLKSSFILEQMLISTLQVERSCSEKLVTFHCNFSSYFRLINIDVTWYCDSKGKYTYFQCDISKSILCYLDLIHL